MFVSEALESDKHVFVEKPLSTTWDGLEKVEKALEKSKGWVTVGFNRRFAPLALELKETTVSGSNEYHCHYECWVYSTRGMGA